MVAIRWLVCFIAFISNALMSVLATGISMIIVTMVKHKDIKLSSACIKSMNQTLNRTSVEDNFGPRYEWTELDQGIILGAYLSGYVVIQIPGGYFAENIGPKITLFACFIVSSVFNMAVPFGAPRSYLLVVLFRFTMGMAGGVVNPAIQTVMAAWVPTDEKGKFSFAFFGRTLGILVSWWIIGALIDKFGYIWAFFIPSFVVLSWSIIWWCVMSDNPETHKWITIKEKLYLRDSIRINMHKRRAPYRKIFKSLPFYGCVTLQMSNIWGLYVLITLVPKLLVEVLGFKITQSGLLGSLPTFCRLIGALTFGFIGDYIIKHKRMSITVLRKSMLVFSHISPAMCLLSLNMVDCQAYLSVAIISLAFLFNGANVITTVANPQDLSPNFAASIYGISTFISYGICMLVPILNGYLLNENTNLGDYHLIFSIGAVIYIISTIIFTFIGSGEEQEFNKMEITYEV